MCRPKEGIMSDAAPHSPPRAEVGNPRLSRRGLLLGGVAGAAAAYGLTASGAAARGSFSGAAPGARGGHRVVRVERVGSRAEEGLRERVQGVHEEDGDRRQGQHGRPQHVPGADQHLPPGPAPGRLHLVRRLPDAVLRVEGPALPDRRRLGAAQAAVCLGLPERLEGGGRALLLRPDLRLPVGGPLPQERVEAARLHDPEDLGPVRRARQEDEGRRAHADRLHATRTAGPRWAPSTSSTCG